LRQLQSLEIGQNLDKVLSITDGHYNYRKDYLLNDEFYRYEIYSVKDTLKNYGLLFKNQTLVSMVTVGDRESNLPMHEVCTPFPPNLDADPMA